MGTFRFLDVGGPAFFFIRLPLQRIERRILRAYLLLAGLFATPFIVYGLYGIAEWLAIGACFHFFFWASWRPVILGLGRRNGMIFIPMIMRATFCARSHPMPFC